jgi:hypothetical protein
MAYVTAEARQRLLDEVAGSIEELARALAALGAAYDLLDEHSADRLEEQLFRPAQSAFGKARRTHAEFAARYGLPSRTFEQPSAGAHARDPREYLRRAIESIEEAEDLFVDLQDSGMPVEVGDAQLRAGIAEIRGLLAQLESRAPQFMRTLGR